jgi:hypothetical protein
LSCLLTKDARSKSGFGPRELKVEQVRRLSSEQLIGYLNDLKDTSQRDAEGALVHLSRCPAPWRFALEWRGDEKARDQIVRLVLETLHAVSDSRALHQRIIDLFLSLRGTHFVAKDGLLFTFVEAHKEPLVFEELDEEGFLTRHSDRDRLVIVRRFLKQTMRLVPDLARFSFQLLQQFFHTDTELLLNVIHILLPNSSNVDDLEWRELPAMLSKDELLHQADPLQLVSSVLASGAYDSPHSYLDTYFRLMRLEGFGKLRNGIRALLAGTVSACLMDGLPHSIAPELHSVLRLLGSSTQET